MHFWFSCLPIKNALWHTTQTQMKKAENQFSSMARFAFSNRDWDQQAQKGDIYYWQCSSLDKKINAICDDEDKMHFLCNLLSCLVSASQVARARKKEKGKSEWHNAGGSYRIGCRILNFSFTPAQCILPK